MLHSIHIAESSNRGEKRTYIWVVTWCLRTYIGLRPYMVNVYIKERINDQKTICAGGGVTSNTTYSRCIWHGLGLKKYLYSFRIDKYGLIYTLRTRELNI